MCLCALASECTYAVCVCPSVCARVHVLVCVPASAKCLRERHLQKASGKESQNNKGNLASSDVLCVQAVVVVEKSVHVSTFTVSAITFQVMHRDKKIYIYNLLNCIFFSDLVA